MRAYMYNFRFLNLGSEIIKSSSITHWAKTEIEILTKKMMLTCSTCPVPEPISRGRTITKIKMKFHWKNGSRKKKKNYHS